MRSSVSTPEMGRDGPDRTVQLPPARLGRPRRILGIGRAQPAAAMALALLCVIVLLCGAATAAPAVRRYDVAATNYDAINQGPSLAHPLGTDQLGRDTWSRLLAATLFSLKVAVAAELVAVTLGFGLGLAAGLGGKWADQSVAWLCDLAYAVPELLLAMVLRQVLIGTEVPILGSEGTQIPGVPGPLLVTVIAISFASWATTCRLVRAQTLTLRNADFVIAARATGASGRRVALTHLVPNTLGPVLVAVTFGIPARMFAEASLGFLGLGVAPPLASLGTLVSDGYQKVHVNGLLVVWPCAMIGVLMLCFSLIGDGVRDAMDPRLRRSARA